MRVCNNMTEKYPEFLDISQNNQYNNNPSAKTNKRVRRNQR